jgi:hypothetical protein
MARAGGANEGRVWQITPSVACVLFFLAHLGLLLGGEPRGETSIAGATAEARLGPARAVRVVAEIRPLAQRARRAQPVPPSERELLELIRRDGAVLFFADEAEVIATPSREFRAEEVEVIAGRARPAPSPVPR